jgi:hemerythrin
MHYPVEHHILGMPEMDVQHAYLYSLFDRIPDTAAITNREAAKVLLDEIERYVLFHFASEEQLMRRYNYQGFAVHQGDHEQMGQKLVQFMDDFDAGRLNPAAMRIFLTGWLMEHSKAADADYVAWVEKCRAVVVAASSKL